MPAKKLTRIPNIGTSAPMFSLQADDGSKISLEQFLGKKHIVLYFYPRDNTPGCTKEACSFRDDLSDIVEQNAVVIGVSPDSIESHAKFKDKHDLPFTLLADQDHKIAEKFGVWVEKNMYGKRHMGIQRATFIIDKSGKIAAAWPRVKVDGHSQEVLETLKKL